MRSFGTAALPGSPGWAQLQNADLAVRRLLNQHGIRRTRRTQRELAAGEQAGEQDPVGWAAHAST
jgi:hypothetical protein